MWQSKTRGFDQMLLVISRASDEEARSYESSVIKQDESPYIITLPTSINTLKVHLAREHLQLHNQLFE